MKLWLDDVRDPRSVKIQEDFGADGDELWVKTAASAIHYLRQGIVESISLDHDLGPPSAGTGLDVARFIEEQAFYGTIPKLVWAVHSTNPVGRKAMTQAMTKADEFWNASPTE
ncbi:cyclic-phosphate processing receiver domain-containing protein [Tuwongella immobilis]|uniref:Cyclic-phosphate processing Receiver domain-containing protein n=1 Tax=Tuwongella immobilis TaxID=692036 RepID=A0A6C2YHI1_9BACT|nr:cyclic-phosphate processing receiver domain-containing protein [Tuwongella immobilis]VIP00946.1 Uncharacterized protein OS=Simkania negevensis (strain ATCC VR-1471 / Z) GN=SNE_A12210 PE=4 SV=1 [Tuwongella immobilis]VTR97310.1 Uncharacterized protein OS=Simkania negevensis (strain ATCC VR-1471 / Z) GN=SNE_A12210 PE=4 SV=1 [Tuwongella immobilis]